MIFRSSCRLLNPRWFGRSANNPPLPDQDIHPESGRWRSQTLSTVCGILYILVIIHVGATTPNSTWAEEPVEEFLKGLRKRGYYDLAFDYLERMKTSQLVSVEVRKNIPYEEALTYLEASRHQRDSELRARQLDMAQQKLQSFLDASSHPNAGMTARNQLGNILAEQARLNLLKADDAESSEEAKKLKLSAREHFEKAYDVFRDLETQFRKKLKDLPKHVDKRSNPKLYAEVTKYRQDFLQTLLILATIIYEKSATTEPESENRKKWLEEAVTAFEDISQKYRNWLAGFYALLYQAHCLQELGQIQDALGIYTELIAEESDSTVYRKLKTKAYTSAMTCWTGESQKNYEEAILQGSTWLATMRPKEQQSQDGLAFRLELARAYKTHADAIKVETPDDPLVKKNYSEAVSHARYVILAPGPLKKEARKFLEKMGDDNTTAIVANPKTFDEARAAGWEWLQHAQNSTQLVALLSDRLTRVKDATTQKDLETQKEEALSQIGKSNDAALESYRQALSLVDPTTPTEDLNGVRYYLGYLLYQAREYYDSAVLSEFVCRNYPDSAVARQCAKITLASYVSLRQDAVSQSDKDPVFELAHLLAIAEYIVDNWPQQQESQEALTTLINLSIEQGKFDEAERYLAKIETGSIMRAKAELRTGQALWRKYLTDSKQLRQLKQSDNPPAEQIAATQKELDGLKDRIKNILESGTDRLKSEKMSAARATAALSLAQLYLDTQETEKARALLEEEKIGCLALVASNHASIQGQGYAQETYKTALRTYISSLAGVTSSDVSDALMKKTEEMMSSLEKIMGDSAAGRKRLIGIYIGLASDLQQQIQLAPAASRKSISIGFESFLSRIVEDSADMKILNWAAEMFFNLGKSNDSEQGQVVGEAKRFYTQAVSTYTKILELDNSKTDPNVMIHIQLRMATILRRTGEFQKSVNVLDNILRERNAMLNVQIEATTTFQEWAAAENVNKYLDAINGVAMDNQSRRKVIWGWATLAKKTSQKPKFMDTFYQARYNLAYCRYQYALAQQGDTRSQKLKLAQRDIVWTAKLNPDLGGVKWKKQFDELLKKIQQALGQPVQGLAA